MLSDAHETLSAYIGSHRRLLVLTGAGLSTASGIGDYRDVDGNYKREPPVNMGDFVKSHTMRQRYWARSLYGWPAFSKAEPNSGHLSLARLQRHGYLAGGLITQNVDGLHERVGHREVVPLHGQLERVLCLDCGAVEARVDLQRRLQEDNRHLLGAAAQLLADGDARLDVADLRTFRVPECRACTGLLKPDVVFFGDSVPKERVQACYDRVAAADALLIVGSSVMVYSSFRFCRQAQQLGLPIAAVNIGKTRADDWLQFKVQQPCVPCLEQVAQLLCDA